MRTLERERDDLKKRNAELEQRLRQLQTTVDNLVHEALGEQPSTQPPALPPAVGMVPRRSFGPFMTQFRPMFPRLMGCLTRLNWQSPLATRSERRRGQTCRRGRQAKGTIGTRRKRR